MIFPVRCLSLFNIVRVYKFEMMEKKKTFLIYDCVSSLSIYVIVVRGCMNVSMYVCIVYVALIDRCIIENYFPTYSFSSLFYRGPAPLLYLSNGGRMWKWFSWWTASLDTILWYAKLYNRSNVSGMNYDVNGVFGGFWLFAFFSCFFDVHCLLMLVFYSLCQLRGRSCYWLPSVIVHL